VNYVIGIVIQPSKTIRRLVKSPDRFKYGLFGVLTLGVLYSLTAFLLSARNIHAAAPFLRLSAETYYFYQGFFNLPVAVASWLLMGTTIYLCIPRPERSCRDVLALIGLPYGLLVLPLMWLPETIAVIGWPSVWETRWWTLLTPIRVGLGTAWLYTGCVLAVKELYGLPWVRSCLVTLAGLLVGVGVSVVFIR
jgi:hypothetical protein